MLITGCQMVHRGLVFTNFFNLLGWQDVHGCPARVHTQRLQTMFFPLQERHCGITATQVKKVITKHHQFGFTFTPCIIQDITTLNPQLN